MHNYHDWKEIQLGDTVKRSANQTEYSIGPLLCGEINPFKIDKMKFDLLTSLHPRREYRIHESNGYIETDYKIKDSIVKVKILTKEIGNHSDDRLDIAISPPDRSIEEHIERVIKRYPSHA